MKILREQVAAHPLWGQLRCDIDADLLEAQLPLGGDVASAIGLALEAVLEESADAYTFTQVLADMYRLDKQELSAADWRREVADILAELSPYGRIFLMGEQGYPCLGERIRVLPGDETVASHWIFVMELHTLSDHLYYIAVPRHAAEAPRVYGILPEQEPETQSGYEGSLALSRE